MKKPPLVSPFAKKPDAGTCSPVNKPKRKSERPRDSARKKAAATNPAAAAEATAPSSASSEAENKLRVFVGRLPQQTTEAMLRSHFGACGTVTGVDMLVRRSNNRFKGAAFVHFASEEGAANALALDGKEMEGKAVAVQAAGEGSKTGQSSEQVPKDAKGEPAPSASSVFVGNLPEKLSEKALRKVFRQCGPIQKIRLMPAAKGEVRGFIDFRFTTGAASAVELNGSAQIGGRRVVVSWSRRNMPVKRDRRSMEARARRKEAREQARSQLDTNGPNK